MMIAADDQRQQDRRSSGTASDRPESERRIDAARHGGRSPGSCVAGRRHAATSRRRAAASRLARVPPVAISRPTSFLSAVRPSTTATISPRYITAIRSDISSTSSSSAETSRTAVPASRLAIDLAVDELDAADVEAARRLVEHEQLQVAVELAGDDDLLLVAARQRAGRRPSADGVRMSNSSIASLRVRARSPRRCAGCPARTAAR